MKTQELIYQIFPETFNDGAQSGFGNLKGIIQKLDYLKWLGVDRIWLTPIFESPFQDSGYDVANYYKINPRFGTDEDLDKLLQEANKREIGVIFDMVFNHTSDQHQWFQKALQGDKKYQDYYFFKSGSSNKPPTNWKSKMGGSTWKYIPQLKKYYLHLFAESQPDLNWENPYVRLEILKILKYWIAKGVKGFRFDVCNLYDKFRGFVDDLHGDGRVFYTDGPKIPEFFEWMSKNTFGLEQNFLTVGEVSSTTKEKSIHYVTPRGTKLDTIFTFLHLKVDFKDNFKWTYIKPDVNKFYTLMREWQTYFQNHNAYLSLFLNNHDQPRSASRFGNKKFWEASVKGLAGFVYLMRGISFIYQGEEIGMTNFPFKNLEEFWDVETLGNVNDLKKMLSEKELLKIAQTKARDNSRSAMQWANQKNAGFTTTISKIPINPNYKNINVESQINNPNSILHFYKKIFVLKKELVAFSEGQIEFLDCDSKVFAYQRKIPNQTLTVIFNWSAKVKPFKFQHHFKNVKVLLNNYKDFNHQLQPYQLLVIEGEYA